MPSKTRSSPITAQTLPADYTQRLHAKYMEEPFWQPASLFHEDIITVATDEVLVWGAKGTGKSTAARVKAARGVPGPGYVYEADGSFHPHRLWCCWHPEFKGLVLRKTADDLNEWFDQFVPLAELLGGVPMQQPKSIRWPMGGITRFGHMADRAAWQKYVGNEQHQVVWEEAVTVDDMNLVNLLTTCIRSSTPDIKPQLMLNCNPLGPGLIWILPRYRNLSPGDGYSRIIKVDGKTIYGEDHIVKPKELIEVVLRDRDGSYITRTMTTLFGKLEDNPVMNTPAYRATLLNNPSNIQAAYLDGTIDQSQGVAFPMIRLSGPRDGEPEHADHFWPHARIEQMLEPWYPIHVGMDWGFAHEAVGVVLHGAKNGRLYGIDEYVQERHSAEELGYQVGLRIRVYLLRGQDVTVWFSPDAWGVRNETSPTIQLMLRGLSRATDGRILLADDMLKAEDEWLAPRGTVGVRKARDRRVEGAEKLRGLLRWNPLLPEGVGHPFSAGTAERIRSEEGMRAYEAYLKSWKQTSPEELPRLIFSREKTPMTACALRDALQDAKNALDVTKEHWRGADRYDALRYGAMGWKEDERPVPHEIRVARQMEALRASGLDPMSLSIHQKRLAAEKARTHVRIEHLMRHGHGGGRVM